MQLIRHLSSCPPDAKGAVLALGNFDGVHRGHQAIIARCIGAARALGVPSAVMTFEPHPREFFAASGEQRRLRIYSLRRKIALIRDMGVDALFVMRFNREFASLSADNFVTGIMCRQLEARHIVTGSDFAFGKGRAGDTTFLQAMSATLGFGFTACLPVVDAAGEIISSTAIRAHLAQGEMQIAARLLGRPYAIEGRVAHGEKRGRTLGFPTANLSMDGLFLPRLGVYAARLLAADGIWHDGVASIGVKPTFGVHQPLLEVHLFDTQKDLYGQRVTVAPLAFLRPEQRFDSAAALVEAMQNDSREARAWLAKDGLA